MVNVKPKNSVKEMLPPINRIEGLVEIIPGRFMIGCSFFTDGKDIYMACSSGSKLNGFRNLLTT